MEFVMVVIMGMILALIFTGYGIFSKKDWSYADRDYNGNETRSQFRAAFVVIVIVFVVIWYAGSNRPG
jgi:hypothetical protein